MTDRELMDNLIRAWESCKADLLMGAIRSIRERLEQPIPPEGWHGLTKSEVKILWSASNNYGEFADLLQAKLKEKNADKTGGKVT